MTTGDRAELKRKYKESRQPMGVFRIRNTVNGKAFIGSSPNLPAILNRHRFDLKLKSHRNRLMQEEWNRDGEDSFVFEVLEELEPSDAPSYDPSSDLATLEELWLDKLRPYGDQGYNKGP